MFCLDWGCLVVFCFNVGWVVCVLVFVYSVVGCGSCFVFVVLCFVSLDWVWVVGWGVG